MDKLEREIRLAFKKFIYAPLLKQLGIGMDFQNSQSDPLLAAISSGRITYSKGAFRGQFNASISKRLIALGAEFVNGTYKIPLSELPYELRVGVGVASSTFVDRMSAINRKLASVAPADIAEAIDFTKIFDSILIDFNGNFQKTLEGITITPSLSLEARRRIRDEWRKNMELSIQDFTENEIAKLRSQVSKNVLAGNRYGAMVKTIRHSYGVSENKARFLARQETNLLVTKLRDIRYRDAGINEYRWQCVVGSPAHPVRPAHAKLNGKVFSWKDPPITSEPNQAVRRCNPGQDYNCRCIARPIVRA